MKKIIILLLCCITAVVTQAQSRNWCESLVNTLNANENVDKTIAVKRDPSTHEITNATYDYRFTSDNLYKKIAKEMKFRSTNADYYTEKGKKLKTIILRFNDRGRRWSCKLQCLDKKGKQFLVTVSSRDQSSSELQGLQGLTDVERIQDFNERQQEWAKQYKERQQEWAKQYKERQQEWAKQYKERQQEWDKQNRERQQELKKRQQEWAKQYKERQQEWAKQYSERQQELKKRQQEVRERQRQVQRETRERQREARERQRLARRQRLNVEGSNGTYYRKHIITAEEEKENKKAIEQHNADLKKAEQERKRKLDL